MIRNANRECFGDPLLPNFSVEMVPDLLIECH